MACTDILQNSHQGDFHDFIFTKLTSESSYKTLKLWKIYDLFSQSMKILFVNKVSGHDIGFPGQTYIAILTFHILWK